MKCRTLVIQLVGLVLLLRGLDARQRGKYVPSAESLQRAKDILDQHPIIDGHMDFAMGIKELLNNDISSINLTQNIKDQEPWASYEYKSCLDLPRIKEGRLGGQFWSAFVNCDSSHVDAVQLFLQQIDVIKRLVASYPNDFDFVTDAVGIERAMAQGKLASLIGVESGHAINSDMSTLRFLYALGARYMTLTHICNTPWADAAQSEIGQLPVRNNGLSDYGKKVVLEMNRLGMFVDLSHVSINVMRDALDTVLAPVIFSHSSSRTVHQHPRNVPDEILQRLPTNGGVVMVNFYPYFLTGTETADVLDIVAHINHIRRMAGVDHIGFGSDFCGIEVAPEGVEDVTGYPLIIAALIESSEFEWTDEDLAKLANGNLLRAMHEMEAVRDSLAELGVIPEQDIMPFADFLPEETLCMTLQGSPNGFCIKNNQ